MLEKINYIHNLHNFYNVIKTFANFKVCQIKKVNNFNCLQLAWQLHSYISVTLAITQTQGKTWKQSGAQISGIAIFNLQTKESSMTKNLKKLDAKKLLPVFKFHGDFGEKTHEYANMVVSKKAVNRIVNGKRVPVVHVNNYRAKTLADTQEIFSDEYINLVFWTAYNPRLNNPERVAEGKSDEERQADDIASLSRLLKKAVKAGDKKEEVSLRQRLIAIL